MSVPLLSRLVAAAVNISNKSARILREVKRSGELNVQEKAANDYVTKADFLSQLNIVRSLESLFPKLKICGEEGELKDEYNDLVTTFDENVLEVAKTLPSDYDALKEEELFVWVDPLDGTKEYTQGSDVSRECTVLIGISWNGKPIAGVVNQPFYKRIDQQEEVDDDSAFGRYLWGIVGLGAFDSVKGKLTVPSKQLEPLRSRTLVTTRSHITDLIRRDLQSIPNSQIIQRGGCGYKILSIIDEESDAYVYPSRGCKRWDTCAPEALIRSLNGSLVDVFGNSYTYGEPTEYQLIENLYGVVASINDPPSLFYQHFSDEVKRKLIDDAEKIKAEKANSSQN